MGQHRHVVYRCRISARNIRTVASNANQRGSATKNKRQLYVGGRLMAKIYLAQMEPVLFDKAANLSKMKWYMEQAADQQAQLILFPELCLTGYFTREKTMELAEDLHGSSILQMQDWAQEYNLKIIFGFIEKKEGSVYNSACFINNDGTIIGTYQKNHLWDEEPKYFSAGNTYSVWDTDIGKIGIMICYDTEFPEASRILALKDAQIILAPTANMSPLEHAQQVLIQCRALENQLFVATTNRVGQEETTNFFGESAAADPFGKLIVHGSQAESGYLIEIDLNKITEARRFYNYLKDRKMETYSIITEPAYLKS